MRGRVHRSDIVVTREEEFEINYLEPSKVIIIWTASFDAPLWSERDQELENLSLSFAGRSYDEALDRLMDEFKDLDIEVVL